MREPRYPWTDEDQNWIEDNSHVLTTKFMAERLGRSELSVRLKRHRLLKAKGLTRKQTRETVNRETILEEVSCI